MRKHCSNVCKLRPYLATESTYSARMRTIVTAALQRRYSQTELIFWITVLTFYTEECYVYCIHSYTIFHLFFCTLTLMLHFDEPVRGCENGKPWIALTVHSTVAATTDADTGNYLVQKYRQFW